MATPLEVFLQGRDGTRQAFNSLSSNLDKVRQGTAGLLARWRDLTIVAGGVVRVARQISQAFSETLHAAERQVNAEVKLAAALRGTGGELTDNIQRLREFASQRQAITTFGDEVTLELATIGAEFGLTVDEIEKAVVAVQDRSLALGRGPLELMRVVARFGGGVADSLIDVGVVVDKNADRAKEFTRAMAEMTSGMSELVGSLPTSALSKLENTFGDLQEGIGKVISSTGTFQAIVRTVEGWVQELNEALDNRETLETVRKAIDDFVIGTVRVFRFLAAGVLTTVADILDAVGSLVAGFQLVGAIPSIESLERQMRTLKDSISALNPEVVDEAAKMELLSGQLEELEAQHARVSRATSISGDSFRQAALTVTGWAEDIEQAIGSSRSWIDAQGDIFEALQKTNEALEAQRENLANTEALEKAREALAAMQEVADEARLNAENIGAPFGAGIQASIVDAFDQDVGAAEAAKNLGKRMRVAVIEQFSGAALQPIMASFGQIADAASAPFKALGNLIASILENTVGALLVNLGLTEAISTQGKKGAVEAAAEATTVGSAWGAAAVAATIATLGGALGTVPGALAAITAGAALTKALSGFSLLAEGGIVMPRPGGTPVILGEAGRAEAVIPLDRGSSFGGPPVVNISMEGATFVGVGIEEVARAFGDEFLFRTRNLGVPRGMGALI